VSVLKILKVILLLLVSISVNANEVTRTDENNSDSTVLLDQKIHECLALVDKAVVQLFINKGIELNKTIVSLCEVNNRNIAQNHAVGFALEIQNSKDMVSFKQCSKIAPGLNIELQKILKTYFVSDLRFKHICD
jgi:hypothetical protein